MKLLHVSSSYPLRDGDPTAPFMEEMLAALVAAGHEVSVVVPRVVDLEEGNREGVEVIGAPYAPTALQNWGYGRSLTDSGNLKKTAITLTPFAIAAMTRAVRRHIRRTSPDVIHLHWALPQGVIGFAIPDTMPVVISIHGADARYMRGGLAPIARRVLRRADAVIAASSGILNVASQLAPDVVRKSRVIPHGANRSLFQAGDRAAARRALGLRLDTALVIGVGRLVKKKGFDHLLEATRHLDGVDVVILGEGPERSHLQAIEPRALLPGAATRQQVALWLTAADVVAIPSVVVDGDIDSGPVVLMEAMAAGRPVVTTPIGMAADLVVDGVNGHILESLAAEDFANALTSAIENKESLGAHAEGTFAEIGDWSRVASDLVDLYAELLATPRSDSNS